jgi:DNA-binding Lrp family transcriptional regulator
MSAAARPPPSGGEPLLDPLGRAFLNRFQGGFPLVERPFLDCAQALGTAEGTLIETVRGMVECGALSRFGPLFDAERLGGRFTLAAMAVPEPDFERVAALLGALPEVAHNYRRDHGLNMWLVLATESEPAMAEALGRVETLAGVALYDFPKLAEYHLGLRLHLGADGSVGVRRIEPGPRGEPVPLDDLDRALVAATQAGLPLLPRPYAQVAEDLGCGESRVVARLARLLGCGAIRRIGAVPNHYRLGLRGNGMTVWDIEDSEVDRIGAEVGALEWVSHCYRRPRRLPLWPYNLFAMVHGRDRAEVLTSAARIEAIVGPQSRGHRVLFSEAVLKKTGLRFVY